MQRSVITQMTNPLEEVFELGAHIDVSLNVVGTDTDVIAAIQTVDISSIFESRSLQYNFNIEVP
jgi:hypothetical protein